ncbi:hypothetical protein BB558_000371 [Smittium angustum]|uniref:Eukaryotic translation initiation factor 3 subunit F n=1 Tax=Smittium angustum TaxID=133377 RepID=A0A2U1JEM6_SMIAN|nr:hypothetical protein BB558_000371 [Smittium angustum]
MSLRLNLSSLQSSETSKRTAEAEKVQDVFLYPSVSFAIIDHYLRRNDKQDRVIGTLLGVRKDGGKTIEVRSCFPVPHFETDSHVEVDMEYHRIFYSTLKKVNPNEEIVGWYATGSTTGKHATLIHDFYALESQPHDAIHMVMDTSLESNSLKIEMFSGTYYGTNSAQTDGCIFSPLSYQMVYPEAERKVLGLLQSGSGEQNSAIQENNSIQNGTNSSIPLVSDMVQLESAIKSLLEMIERVSEYVQKVISGSVEPDLIVGKYLMDMLAFVPRIEADQFETLFQGHLQNLLMVVYLSNLTRAQINIANRLQHIL